MKERFFAKFYTTAVPEFWFITEDKIVTDVIGYGLHFDKFRQKWIGKHINEVRKDVMYKLYKHVIHHVEWCNDPEVQKKVQEYRNLEKRSIHLVWAYTQPLEVVGLGDRAEIKKQFEETAGPLKEVADWLNRRRGEDFGYMWQAEDRYFNLVEFVKR